MIFEKLFAASKRNELMLIDGGFCHWHMRRDGQLTIYEIISTKPGAGTKMLKQLEKQPALSIFAKCPTNLEANKWYEKKGFILEKVETIKSGRKLNHWRLKLCDGQLSML